MSDNIDYALRNLEEYFATFPETDISIIFGFHDDDDDETGSYVFAAGKRRFPSAPTMSGAILNAHAELFTAN
jgi:hypothetical protein